MAQQPQLCGAIGSWPCHSARSFRPFTDCISHPIGACQINSSMDYGIQGSYITLGPVDKPYPETNASEQDEAEEAACGLVISGGDTPLFLEVTNEALDA
jgi:hypothetical protein